MRGLSFSVLIIALLSCFAAQAKVDPFNQPELTNISCSNNFCIGVGHHLTHDDSGSLNYDPLILQFNAADSKPKLVSSFPELNGRAYFTDVSCSNNMCAVIGSMNGHPMIMTKHFNGDSWKVHTNFTGAGPFARLKDITCDDNSCVAVGSNAHRKPLILQSSDSGNSWTTYSNIKNLPPRLNDVNTVAHVSCKDGFCAGVAKLDESSTTQFIIQSKDGGITWSYVDSVSSDVFQLKSIHCSSNVCAVVGYQLVAPFLREPRIYQTDNKGKSWSSALLPTSLIDASLESVYCQDQMCIATGDKVGNNVTLETTNAGASWNIKTITNAVRPGRLTTDCTATFCIAAGSFAVDYNHPHLLAHRDSNHQWVLSTNIPNDLTGRLGFEGASCNATRCLAFSQNSSYQIQLVQSEEMGVWKRVSLDI